MERVKHVYVAQWVLVNINNTLTSLSPSYIQPENVMVVKPATELPVVKLLHFSRAQEVGRAPVIVPPNLDHMEFEGTTIACIT